MTTETNILNTLTLDQLRAVEAMWENDHPAYDEAWNRFQASVKTACDQHAADEERAAFEDATQRPDRFEMD